MDKRIYYRFTANSWSYKIDRSGEKIMKDINKALIDWAIQTIEREYPEDVAVLIGRKGACKIPTDSQNMAFDFFIPATEGAITLQKHLLLKR